MTKTSLLLIVTMVVCMVLPSLGQFPPEFRKSSRRIRPHPLDGVTCPKSRFSNLDGVCRRISDCPTKAKKPLNREDTCYKAAVVGDRDVVCCPNVPVTKNKVTKSPLSHFGIGPKKQKTKKQKTKKQKTNKKNTQQVTA